MGRMLPVLPGVTPGSDPGTWGFSATIPARSMWGAAFIEALGLDLELKPGDVAARANFCTIDDKGMITDRRAASRPRSTKTSARFCGARSRRSKAFP